MRAKVDRASYAAFTLALVLTGCYASHRVGDAGSAVPADARPDARRDAGPADAPIVPADTGITAAPCDRDRDCAEGLCTLDLRLAPDDGARVPLVCGAAGAVSPGVECEMNRECENGLCALAGGCVEPCLEDGDCRVGERCTDVPIVTSRTTMQTATACIRWVDAPPSVTVTENGPVGIAPFSAQLFSLPRSLASHRLVLHVADRVDEVRSIDRVALSEPGGATLHDIGSLLFAPQINPSVAFFDLAPILIPNAPWPSGLDAHGALDYAITAGGESELRRIVLDHDGVGTVLDLNVFFVGAPRTARALGAVEDMLAGYDAMLAGFGLRLGRMREHHVVGASASRFAVIDDDLEVGELFRFSAGAARPAVNVFLIASSTTFLGIAGGIPGAQTVHGARSSGIVLALEDLLSALDLGLGIEFLTMVLAHELGHFAGLFHTSEADGSSFEPLPDTERCGIERDVNGDGMVDAEECMGAGAQNIMFWGSIFGDSRFSPMQQDVIRTAPVLLP